MAVHPDHDGGPISTTQGVVADRRGAPGGSRLEDPLPGNWLYLPVLLEWKGLERGLEQGLEGIAVPERLAEVFDAIIDCDSDAELFARMGM